jgi:hypothetical protein
MCTENKSIKTPIQKYADTLISISLKTDYPETPKASIFNWKADRAYIFCLKILSALSSG